MRRGFAWTLFLWALPGLAAAETVARDAVRAPQGELAIERAMSPALDLQVEGSELSLPPPAPRPPAIGARPTVLPPNAAPDGAERGLSFGMEVRPKGSATTGLARNQEPDEPGLEDNLQRLIDHSTLGLRGTYRF